jgi:alkanesulfonate monooxygenase SsuD/methylene tetrahydromethanopterin reductase-like flavin-dependent oxidoreductase (luciferase family)
MMFAPGQMDFNGKYVHLNEFEAVPKPVQKGGVPIMIGGGSKRVLGIAGREANIISLNFDNSSGMIGPKGVQSSTAEMTSQKIQWVKDGAASVGRSMDDIEIEIGAYFTMVVPDVEQGAAALAKMFGLTAEDMKVHPHALIGDVDLICDTLVARREEYGISYITVGESNLDAFAPVVARLSGK